MLPRENIYIQFWLVHSGLCFTVFLQEPVNKACMNGKDIIISWLHGKLN